MQITIVNTDIPTKTTSQALGYAQVELRIKGRLVRCVKPAEDMLPAVLGDTNTCILDIQCKQVTAGVTLATNAHLAFFRKGAGRSHQLVKYKLNDTGIRRDEEILIQSATETEFYPLLEISEIGINATLAK